MSHPLTHRPLGEILLAKAYVAPERIEHALAEGGDGRLGERLLREGAITEEQLADALAEQFGMEYVDLDGYTVPPELFAVLPASSAYRIGAVPYRRNGRSITVAVADPYDLRLVDRLEHRTGLRVELVLSTPQAIQHALKRSQGTAEVLRDVSEDFRPVIITEDGKGGEKTISLEALGDEAAPVVRLVNTILQAALAKRASDVHIETFEGGIAVKYRIDGVLYPATEVLDRRHHSALISRLKVMAELDIAEKRVPQDGRFKLRMGSRDIDFRVSILPSVHGEDVVIRILDKSAMAEGIEGLSLDHLGMPADVLERFRRAVREPYGMVLITGPTGSGKTTTLYAALSELYTGEEKIITIEDPVEYQLEGIVQVPVNEKKNLTFASGLRSMLRHDPDKIMVGEIRDPETARIAVQSALTGHLVFTTVHANNAFDVLSRFAHMGVDVYSFVSALNCVMAQRLVRLLCPECKREAGVERTLLERSGLDPSRYEDAGWYEPVGCAHCNATGYRGRAAVAEFLDLSPRIRELIVGRRPVSQLRDAAVEEGMRTLREAALGKALAGETTLTEINRVTFVE